MSRFKLNSPLLAGLGIAVALFSFLAGPSTFWSQEVTSGALFSFKHGLAIGITLCIPWLVDSFKTRKLTAPSPTGFALCLVVLFLTDWLTRGYNFFQGPSIRGELLIAGALSWFLIGRVRDSTWVIFGLLSAFGCASAFILQSEGRLLFSDDHGTFLYRLLLLRDHFPHIPFYSPLWNGGYDARDFFATGTLNVLFFTWPFVYLTDLMNTYTLTVAWLMFGLVPAATFVAARLAGLPLGAQCLSSILSLSSGLLWYRWGLSYGTLGYIVSSSLLPINLILATKIIFWDSGITKREAALFVISTSLMLCWSLSSVAFIPVALLALCYIRTVLQRNYVMWIVGALVLINLPWMTLFWSVSNVGKFLKADTSQVQLVRETSGHAEIPTQHNVKATHRGVSFAKSAKILRESAISTNPAILLLLIPGILALPNGLRLTFGLTSLWLLLLGCVASTLKPQLELDRMLVLLFQFSSIPVGGLAYSLLSNTSKIRTFPYKLAASGVGAFVLLGPIATGSFLQGRSVLQYSFAGPLVESLTEAIKDHGGEGRTLFSGFLLHEISGGHAAPLPYWTGKPLMASSPFHNLWRYKQIFPSSYISRGYRGIEEYLNSYNVTAVITHESVWRSYFIDHREDFEEAWRDGRFTIFKRKNYESNYIFSGQASELSQTSSTIELVPLTENLVLKFNYLPFLTSTGCQISGESVSPEVTLIKLSSCKPGERVVIESKSAWHRL